MGKRKEEAPPPGSPAWMATFSDLMNLLLCFFVMLFAMSTIEESKLHEMVAAMNNTVSIFEAGSTAIGDGILISNGVSQLNELDEYINSTGKTADSEIDGDDFQEHEQGNQGNQGDQNNQGQASGNKPSGEQLGEMQDILEDEMLKENEQLAEEVSEALNESQIADQVDIGFTAQYIQLTMNGALLFDSGSVELTDAAQRVLDKVGVILERFGSGIIEIEGHTDNVPIVSARFASNEELSSARALSVFYYLVENTALDPTQLKHAGMGERVPVADNSTPEGRSRNRRVEIRIYNPAQY